MSNHGWTGPLPPTPPEPGRSARPEAPGAGTGRLIGAALLMLGCAAGIGVVMNLARGSGADGLTAPVVAAGDSGAPDARYVAFGGPRAQSLALVARRTPVAASVAPARVELGGVPFVPFHEKRGEYLGAVRLGQWPAEKRGLRDPAYANPRGFFVVTSALRDHRVSPNFTLGEFAMREGARGPGGETYLVLREPLLDKLEAVLAELTLAGVRGADLRVLSGFRAPSYNAGVEGAAESSRHQFGDAADVIVDANRDGRMDDLNHDGRVDRADVYVVADAIERIERRRPDLVGGLGLYEAQGPSGPFLHIDVRGKATRWGTALAGGRTGGSAAPGSRWSRTGSPARAPEVVTRPGCRAEGEQAALLCATSAERRSRGD